MASMPAIIPISDLRQDAATVVRQVSGSDEPVFITQRGRAAAVLVSTRSYERTQHELEILRLIARGESEIQAGQGYDFSEVMGEAETLLTRA